jgi:acid stress chaperone HdeB
MIRPVLSLLLVAAATTFAHAQVTLDVSKITCDQWAGYKITNPQNIAFWLSGYYNGKRGNTVLDTQRLTADTNKLRDFCLTRPQMPIMQAVDEVMAATR